MRVKFKCNCDSMVTTNTLKGHIKSARCSLDDKEKQRIFKILELKTKHTFGWLKKDSQDALAKSDWFISVILNKTQLDDWSFTTPRSLNCDRPSTLKRFSEERKGLKNPGIKNKIKNYNIDELKQFAKQKMNCVMSDKNKDFSFIQNQLNKKYPDFTCQFADLSVNKIQRGYNQINLILSILLDLNIDEVIKLKQLIRGRKISRGQKNSEKFIQHASRIGSELLSSRRVTKPHLKLFNLVKQYDENASIEYKLKIGNRHRSYDIYSPRINALIEMHGRTWHDMKKSSKKLDKIRKYNIKNDEMKQKFAITSGYAYYIFWDDEDGVWADTIRSIYEN